MRRAIQLMPLAALWTIASEVVAVLLWSAVQTSLWVARSDAPMLDRLYEAPFAFAWAAMFAGVVALIMLVPQLALVTVWLRAASSQSFATAYARRRIAAAIALALPVAGVVGWSYGDRADQFLWTEAVRQGALALTAAAIGIHATSTRVFRRLSSPPAAVSSAA